MGDYKDHASQVILHHKWLQLISMKIFYLDNTKGNKHYNEQVVNVIEGEPELTVDGKTFKLIPGNVMVLETNVVHSGVAVKACKVIDIFHPVHKDFVNSSFGGYPCKKYLI